MYRLSKSLITLKNLTQIRIRPKNPDPQPWFWLFNIWIFSIYYSHLIFTSRHEISHIYRAPDPTLSKQNLNPDPTVKNPDPQFCIKVLIQLLYVIHCGTEYILLGSSSVNLCVYVCMFSRTWYSRNIEWLDQMMVSVRGFFRNDSEGGGEGEFFSLLFLAKGGGRAYFYSSPTPKFHHPRS